MNKIIKVTGLIVIILFLSLYFSNYNNDYYEHKNNLTEEAIKNYEKDLKAGKNIIPGNYIKEEKNYANKASIIGTKVSSFIETIFQESINAIIKVLEKTSNKAE